MSPDTVGRSNSDMVVVDGAQISAPELGDPKRVWGYQSTGAHHCCRVISSFAQVAPNGELVPMYGVWRMSPGKYVLWIPKYPKIVGAFASKGEQAIPLEVPKEMERMLNDSPYVIPITSWAHARTSELFQRFELEGKAGDIYQLRGGGSTEEPYRLVFFKNRNL